MHGVGTGGEDGLAPKSPTPIQFLRGRTEWKTLLGLASPPRLWPTIRWSQRFAAISPLRRYAVVCIISVPDGLFTGSKAVVFRLIPNTPSPSSHWASFVNTQYIALMLASTRHKAVRAGLQGAMPKVVQPASGDPAYQPGRAGYVQNLCCLPIKKTPWELLQSPHARALRYRRFEFTNQYLQNFVTRAWPHLTTRLSCITCRSFLRC